MKHLCFLVISLLCSSYAFNAQLTVHNQLLSGAQYQTIQSAIDAAQHGDTIYVHGSPVVYAGFTVTDKKLFIFGPGWAPDKNTPSRAVINSLSTIRNSSASTSMVTANGSAVEGLVFSQELRITGSNGGDQPVSNIRVARCEFRTGISFSLSATNIIFEGNYITGSLARISFGTTREYSNFLIHNNIFRKETYNNGFFTGLINTAGILIDHNLFYTNAPGATGSPVFTNGAANYLTLTNNVFVNCNTTTNLHMSTFNNNITYYPSSAITTIPSAPWATGTNIDAGGNINNTNPQISAQTDVNTGADNPLLNYSISAGSPAKAGGSDGMDMGLRFDATGMLNWNNSRAPRIPYIYSINITNPTISAGTNLNVEVTAKKNN